MARPLRAAEEGSPSFAGRACNGIADILEGWGFPERFALGAIDKAVGAAEAVLDGRIPGPGAPPALEVKEGGEAASKVITAPAAGITPDLNDPHPFALRARGPT